MNYSAGVEYGYSLPVAYRLNIDFTIARRVLGRNLLRIYSRRQLLRMAGYQGTALVWPY